jgi:hypothetical protein
MGIRDSVSKPFKKLKNRLAEGSRKRKEGSKGDNNRGGETDVEESEADQGSNLHPETEDVTKSGASQEEGGGVAQAIPSTSTPSISHSDSGKPNGMQTQTFQSFVP